MISIDTVLLKVASRCNIACDYCYMYFMGDSGWSRVPKSMAPDTIDAVIQSLAGLHADQRQPFATVLHGGEPLLLSEDRLERLLRGIRRHLPRECSLSIQTNGVLISESILDLCADTNTNISISLDGPQKVNDLHRVGATGETTFEQTMQGIRLLQSHREAATLFTGILCVIDPSSNPAEVYSFFKSIFCPSLNFLFRDGNHSKLPFGKESFQSQEYGRWVAGLWDIYYQDPHPIPIRTLDDVARLILGARATKEGMGTSDYAIAVIDTDGRISKNDTLKSSFDGADQFESKWTVFQDRLSAVANSTPFHEYMDSLNPINATCKTCPYLAACGGGMPLYRWSDDDGFDNPSVYCNDHKFVIDRVRQTILSDLRCTSQ